MARASASSTAASSEPTASAVSRLPDPGCADCLYLIDLSGYVFRAYHAIAPLSSSKGEPTHAVLGTVNMLQKVVNEKRPHLLAVAMDSKGITFRHELDTRYKSNRPAAPPDLAQQMARCEQIVRAYNIPIYQVTGLEADDLIASVVDRALAANVRVVIVSADKDLMQLVRDDDDRVLLWDSMRDKVYGPAEVRAKFGVPPSKLRDLLALTGDTSDNVPGVPSVGPKTASDLLNEYGSLEGIYANVDKIKKAKLKEMLVTHEEDARVSQKLVTLQRDVTIDWDLAHLAYGGANEEALRALFAELEFLRLLDLLKPTAPTTRSYSCVVEKAALEAIAATARERGVLALSVEASSPDAMRAEIVGLSLATAPGEGFYVPIAHRYLGCPPQLDWATVRAVLAPLLADPNVKVVAHNLKHVEVLLSKYDLRLEGAIFDTLLASYLLDPETPNTIKELARRDLSLTLTTYEEATSKQRGSQLAFDEVDVERATSYAGATAEAALALAALLEPRIERDGLLPLMRDVELPLSRVLAQMEQHGVLVDVKVLETLGARIEQQLQGFEAEAKVLAGRDFSVRSRDQLEKILFDELNLPVLKRTPKGGRSTDASVLEELAESHALPKIICSYRELDKLKGTYIDALPKAVNPKTGRIHTRFNQTVAATGRLSSEDPNLQNIPIRTEVGREIRAAFVAPKGYRIVSADYSQIELRVLAHLAHDEQLVEAFRLNEDVHTRTASLVFGVPKDQVTREMRGRAKTINFGVIYGMGDSALAKQIDVSRDEAASFIAAYFDRYAGVARFMAQTVESARRGEAVRTLLGRRRFLPNLHSANRGLRFEAERIAKNTPIQGTAADILKLAMVKLGSREVVPGARMILTVHDELVFEVPEAHVEEASRRIKEEMEGALKLDVPLLVEVGSGANWNEAH
jgi:DNA polymerase-1